LKIGERLKRLRIINSLTQEELASRADLTKGFISQLENDATSPSIATLKDILDVFGVSMQEFFSDTTDAEDIVYGKDAVQDIIEPQARLHVHVIRSGRYLKHIDSSCTGNEPTCIE